MPGGGAEHETHHGHFARQLGEAHQVAGPAARTRLGDAVPGSLQHHDQGHPFLPGQLAEAIALVGGSRADGAAEHGDVLGPGERRPAVDAPGPGNERVCGDGRILCGADQLSDFEERSGIEEGGQALAGIETATLVLASEADLTTHGKGLGLPARNLRQGRGPVLRFIAHGEGASSPEGR